MIHRNIYILSHHLQNKQGSFINMEHFIRKVPHIIKSIHLKAFTNKRHIKAMSRALYCVKVHFFFNLEFTLSKLSVSLIAVVIFKQYNNDQMRRAPVHRE